MIDLSPFQDLVPLDHGIAVTRRADGTTHATVVNAGVLPRHLLRDVFGAAGGTHEDWATYDRTIREERRAAVFVSPSRVYTNPAPT